MERALETVLRDEALAVRWMPGATGRLVVVFTGARRGFGGAHPVEFAGSAAAGGDAVLFVTDRRSTWFAAPGLWRRVVGVVRYVRLTERMREVVALGSSMGGWGAILLARDVAVRRVLAFSPQVAMDRAVLDDPRWPQAADLGAPPATDLRAALRPATEYTVVASEGARADRRHMALLPRAGNVRRMLLPGDAHNAAGAMKAAGVLAPFVAAVMDGARGEAARLIETMRAPAPSEEASR